MPAAKEALADILLFAAIIVGALALDALLHIAGRPDWGRWLGYVGTGLIAASFLHSLRKRKRITFGKAPWFLRLHEVLAWTGAMLVVVHAGIHFEALLPWLALIAMLVTVASGLTGKYLLKKSKIALSERRRAMEAEGLSPEAAERRLYLDSLMVDAMKNWRRIHVPVTTTFGLLVVLHVLTVLLYWKW